MTEARAKKIIDVIKAKGTAANYNKAEALNNGLNAEFGGQWTVYIGSNSNDYGLYVTSDPLYALGVDKNGL